MRQRTASSLTAMATIRSRSARIYSLLKADPAGSCQYVETSSSIPAERKKSSTLSSRTPGPTLNPAWRTLLASLPTMRLLSITTSLSFRRGTWFLFLRRLAFALMPHSVSSSRRYFWPKRVHQKSDEATSTSSFLVRVRV